MIGEKTTARGELESLFRQFPDVPREVVLKEDVLRHGLAFTAPALKVGEGSRTKTYGGWLFSVDYVRPEEAAEVITRIPDFIDAHGGLYGLRGRLRIRCRVNPASRYVVDVQDGGLVLCEREEDGLSHLADIYPYRPVPEYWSMRFEDGTPYKEVIREDFIVLFMNCQHWGPKEECKFCDINENARAAKARGALTIPQPFKKVEHVAAAAEWVFLKEGPKRPAYDRPRNLTLSGGAVVRKLDGLAEDEFYLRYVRAIRERIGSRWPLTIQTAPKPKDIARKYKAEGVDCHDSNMEVWDRRLFPIICPGKERAVGRENWLRLMLEEVDVYGEGSVCPGFVQGCETAKPWGLSVDDAVKSYQECYEVLMSHGVVPRPISWYVEPMSDLAGQEKPPTEYFVRIDQAWYETWRKYRLPPPRAYLTGPGVSEFANSAAFDMSG